MFAEASGALYQTSTTNSADTCSETSVSPSEQTGLPARDSLEPAPHHTPSDIRILQILKRIRDGTDIESDIPPAPKRRSTNRPRPTTECAVSIVGGAENEPQCLPSLCVTSTAVPQPRTDQSEAAYSRNQSLPQILVSSATVVTRVPALWTSNAETPNTTSTIFSSPLGLELLLPNGVRIPVSTLNSQCLANGFNGASPANPTVTEVGPVRGRNCACLRSSCLKLYCDCFAAGRACEGCHCRQCGNSVLEDSTRRARDFAIRLALAKNPMAFRSKIGKPATSVESDSNTDGQGAKHLLGCKCKRSHCQKNYCECFLAKVHCNRRCRCVCCFNREFAGKCIRPAKRPSVPCHKANPLLTTTSLDSDSPPAVTGSHLQAAGGCKSRSEVTLHLTDPRGNLIGQSITLNLPMMAPVPSIMPVNSIDKSGIVISSCQSVMNTTTSVSTSFQTPMKSVSKRSPHLSQLDDSPQRDFIPDITRNSAVGSGISELTPELALVCAQTDVITVSTVEAPSDEANLYTEEELDLMQRLLAQRSHLANQMSSDDDPDSPTNQLDPNCSLHSPTNEVDVNSSSGSTTNQTDINSTVYSPTNQVDVSITPHLQTINQMVANSCTDSLQLSADLKDSNLHQQVREAPSVEIPSMVTASGTYLSADVEEPKSQAYSLTDSPDSWGSSVQPRPPVEMMKPSNEELMPYQVESSATREVGALQQRLRLLEARVRSLVRLVKSYGLVLRFLSHRMCHRIDCLCCRRLRNMAQRVNRTL